MEFFGCVFFFFLSRIELHKLWYGKGWYASLTVVCSFFICLKYLKLDFKEKNQKYASKLAILIVVDIVNYLY